MSLFTWLVVTFVKYKLFPPNLLQAISPSDPAGTVRVKLLPIQGSFITGERKRIESTAIATQNGQVDQRLSAPCWIRTHLGSDSMTTKPFCFNLGQIFESKLLVVGQLHSGPWFSKADCSKKLLVQSQSSPIWALRINWPSLALPKVSPGDDWRCWLHNH